MMLRWLVIFFKYFMLAFIGLSYPVFASDGVVFLPDEYKQKIDMAVKRNAVDRPALVSTITWIKQLAQSTQSPTVFAELARLEYANAEVETEKSNRIELYKGCIVTADRALTINADEVGALYWKAVAMGKLSEESGILNALRMTRPMEQLFCALLHLMKNTTMLAHIKHLAECIINCQDSRSVLVIRKKPYSISEERIPYFQMTLSRAPFTLKCFWIWVECKKPENMQYLFSLSPLKWKTASDTADLLKLPEILQGKRVRKNADIKLQLRLQFTVKNWRKYKRMFVSCFSTNSCVKLYDVVCEYLCSLLKKRLSVRICSMC